MERGPGTTRETQKLECSEDVDRAESSVGEDPVYGRGRVTHRVHLASELVVSRFTQAKARMRQVAGNGVDAAVPGAGNRR